MTSHKCYLKEKLVCVCMYECVRTSMCACIHVRTQPRTHAHTHIIVTIHVKHRLFIYN